MADAGVDWSFNSSSESVFANKSNESNSFRSDQQKCEFQRHLDRNEIPITKHLDHHKIPHVIPKALGSQQNSYHWALRSLI